jgi:hypothetical protein
LFGRLDDICIASVNRLAGHLQQDMGYTMPAILRQAATGTIMATVLSIIAALMMRSPAILAIMVLFGLITIAAFVKLLQRYSRDAERDWTSDLARDYAVRAIGAMEGQRGMRCLGLGFSILSVALMLTAASYRAFDLVDISMVLLIAATMLHLYFSCAEPKPPGTRRREAKLAFAGGRG